MATAYERTKRVDDEALVERLDERAVDLQRVDDFALRKARMTTKSTRRENEKESERRTMVRGAVGVGDAVVLPVSDVDIDVVDDVVVVDVVVVVVVVDVVVGADSSISTADSSARAMPVATLFEPSIVDRHRVERDRADRRSPAERAATANGATVVEVRVIVVGKAATPPSADKDDEATRTGRPSQRPDPSAP